MPSQTCSWGQSAIQFRKFNLGTGLLCLAPSVSKHSQGSVYFVVDDVVVRPHTRPDTMRVGIISAPSMASGQYPYEGNQGCLEPNLDAVSTSEHNTSVGLQGSAHSNDADDDDDEDDDDHRHGDVADADITPDLNASGSNHPLLSPQRPTQTSTHLNNIQGNDLHKEHSEVNVSHKGTEPMCMYVGPSGPRSTFWG